MDGKEVDRLDCTEISTFQNHARAFAENVAYFFPFVLFRLLSGFFTNISLS